jgi:hypothetical protein
MNRPASGFPAIEGRRWRRTGLVEAERRAERVARLLPGRTSYLEQVTPDPGGTTHGCRGGATGVRHHVRLSTDHENHHGQ